jgi:streptomycin 6-kinase
VNKVTLKIPARLLATCGKSPKREAWLAKLPETISTLEQRWSLALGPPFEEASVAWVAPIQLPDGAAAVLKVALPTLEGQHEIDGLRFWNGEPTVQLLASDRALGAMLLERCEPGIALWKHPKPEQDLVLADVLKRLWRVPVDPHPFRHLSVMVASWTRRTRAAAGQWPDAGLTEEGLRVLGELLTTAPTEVLLATDLHPGNVLQARRAPWLAVDPRPFVGDPAYDATQHLLNYRDRWLPNPRDTIQRFAELAELDPERVRLWTFARAAAQPRSDWSNDPLIELARAIAP